jgi:hypothetical protein
MTSTPPRTTRRTENADATQRAAYAWLLRRLFSGTPEPVPAVSTSTPRESVGSRTTPQEPSGQREGGQADGE